MRILWLSNSPMVGSGYGGQTALFTPRLRDMGHEVAIAANFGIQGATTFWNDMPVFSAQAHNETISTFARHWRADWVISLYDAWVFKVKDWDEMKIAMWAPVDEWPPPVAVIEVLKNEKVRPIAMSRFGEHWLKKSGLDPLYVPHGVDTAVFQPHPERRAADRAVLEMPEDAFVVGMVGANRGWSKHACRKAFPQAFDAFAQFARRHDDAYLYVHTQAQPKDSSGALDLILMSRAMGIPEDRLAFPPDVAWHLHVMDNRFVAGLMNSFDVLLNPSMSEGFGIPLIEAQACGVPVIVSDHSSMPELCQSGWLVSGDRWWDGAQMAFGIMPSVDSILDRLEEAYENRGNQQLRDDAVEFAQTYDADRVAEMYWKPALEVLDRPKEIGPLNGKVEVQGLEEVHGYYDKTLNREMRRKLKKR